MQGKGNKRSGFVDLGRIYVTITFLPRFCPRPRSMLVQCPAVLKSDAV